jgi:hypothetical protein
MTGKSPCNGIVKVERTSCHLVAGAPDRMLGFGAPSIPGWQHLTMSRIEALLIAAFERNVRGDHHAVLEDLDLVGEHVNVEHPPPRRLRDAIEIAADAHHALMGEPPFELQHGAIRSKRQRPE